MAAGHSLPQVLVEEFDHDIIRVTRFRDIGIQEEDVKQALPDMQIRARGPDDSRANGRQWCNPLRHVLPDHRPKARAPRLKPPESA